MIAQVISAKNEFPFLLRILYLFGIDLLCLKRKFLVYNLLSRNLKIKYRRSVFGVFWTLISPIASALVYYCVFKIVLKVQTPHYLAFILGGVLPWSFFNQTLLEGMESIVSSLEIVTKVPIPLYVFAFVNALTNLTTLLLALPVVLGVACVIHAPLGMSVILLPLIFLILFLTTYCLSSVLSIFYVYFRDLRHIMTIVLQLWFYATPVIYHENMIPSQYQWILHLNPISSFFIAIHTILIEGAWPSQANWFAICGWALLAYIGAGLVHKHFNRNIVEII